MSKTFLQLQNKVYHNLRIDEISSHDDADEYQLFIRDIINAAKEEIEDAWQWHTFRKEITWASVASQKAYDLTATTAGSGDAEAGSNVWLAGRSYPYRTPYGQILGFDTTTSGEVFQLDEVPYWYGHREAQNSNDREKPHRVYFSPIGINFVNAPDSANRTYSMIALIPQDELEDTDDTLTLPYWQPVVALATAWAVNERGEELGNVSRNIEVVLQTDWGRMADRLLAKAISRDSSLDASELIMDSGQIPWSGGAIW